LFFADLSETTHLLQNRKEAISAVDGPPFCLKARGESKANNDVWNIALNYPYSYGKLIESISHIRKKFF
jgi:hypothetical protein